MSRTTSPVARTVSIAVCIVLFAAMAHAQYRTSIQGVVTDPTGAVVPGANLTLTNPATGEKQVRVSSDAGVFNFNALAAARFRLEVQKDGFQKKVIDNLELIPEQANSLTVQLVIGAASTTVNVDASAAPLLDTETATIDGVVSANQVQHMPSYGRDVLKLAQLAPGVFGDGSQASGGGGYNLPGTETGGGASGADQGIFNTENGAPISANGQQTPNNGVVIDGISTTSAVWGGTTIVTPSEESIESFKVVSNDYDAEDGRFSGAQIQITSKSGTNEYHGSAFLTAHRPGLNAYQPFDGNGNTDLRDPSRFNQIGGSVGGPIIRNKVFGFFSYETIREHTNVPGNQWADTSAFDALAPAGTIASTLVNYPGNNILNTGINTVTCQNAGLVDVSTDPVHGNCHAVTGGLNIGTPLNPVKFPTGQVVAGQDPGWVSSSAPGTGGDGSGGPENLGTVADIANYITSNPTTLNEGQYNIRVDSDVTTKDRIGFAIYWVPLSRDNYNGNRALDIFHHNQVNEAFSPIWNHTFSPTLLNEARVNAAGWRWNEITSNPQAPVGLPSDGLDSSIGSVSVNSFGPNVGSHLDQWTYSFKDVATKIIGPHTVKFGGELTRLFYLNDCFGCGIPGYGFFNLWDFLNDAPRREGYTTFNPTTGLPTTYRQDEREGLWGFFAQDDYKLRKNLTLNLGLRWSYFSPLSSKENNLFVAHPGAGNAYLTGLTVTEQHSGWTAQKNNFGPEIGFAWSPTGLHDKLVVRGGYGLNYNQEEIALTANLNENPGLDIGEYVTMASPTALNPGIIYGASTSPSNPFGYAANPNFTLKLGTNGLPTGTNAAGVAIFPSTLPTLRVHHYSLEGEYDLGHNFVASLGYQGSLSHNLLLHQNPLAVPSTLGYTLNPNINGGDFWNNNGSGNYNAMLAELKHNFSRQFMADAQFTWSKSMDNTSRPYTEPLYPYDPNLAYGPSDYNVTRAFKIFGMWQPIIFHGERGWLEKVAGGWSLSGIFNIHSGFPWSPLVNVTGGSLYCGQCGYTALYPAAYLGGAGSSTSNDAFKNGSNYPLGGAAYFSTPTYTAFNGTASGTAVPEVGVHRNSLKGPGYRDLDLTLAKGFGFPHMRVLGENARLEFRFDVYNVFNNLNFDSTSISNTITNSNFGQAQGALGARTATLGARFSF
jgi:hypothetical protein